MDRKQLLKTGAAVGAGTLVGVAPAQADDNRDESGNRAIGSWFGTVTATNPPLGSFSDILSIHEGGVVTESRRYYVVPPPPFPNLLETTGHGAWKRTGHGSVELFFRFLLQEPPPSSGSPIGTDNIRITATLDAGGQKLTGTFVSQVKDNAGNVLIQVEGTYAADRITV
jgi:hypothetical protein